MQLMNIYEDLFQTSLKMKDYERLLVNAVISFMKSKFGFDAKITVKKKDSKTLIGDVILNDNSLNKNKFTLHFTPNQSYKEIIKSLIHELIHTKQISKKELRPSDDYKSLIWKNDYTLSVKDYKKKAKNFSDYKTLPWEKEAYANMDKLYAPFLKSKYWTELKGKNSNLDFIIDNI